MLDAGQALARRVGEHAFQVGHGGVEFGFEFLNIRAFALRRRHEASERLTSDQEDPGHIRAERGWPTRWTSAIRCCF